MMKVTVDISIGPVQGFVAQSRRTRDLWGSSYLLSVLSAHAMTGAQRAGGTVIRPYIDVNRDPLLQWVSGRGVGTPPAIGSIPNHFIVAVDEAQARGVVTAAEESLKAAWERVCGAVWRTFVEPVIGLGDGTREIWERQVESFWEFVWVIGAEDEHDLLHRRKHWRSHRLPDEPGDKCMVMPAHQELSGHLRAGGAAARGAQDAFWSGLRKRLGPLDLRVNERVSALALVKRLYPKIAEETLGWELDTSHWSSTVYVGALPWIREVAEKNPELASAYARAVRSMAPDVIAEKVPALAGPSCAGAGDFARLDANYFHESFIADERLCPLDRVEVGADQERARLKLVSQLKGLREVVGRAPSAFYAILLADGDRLGDLVVKLGGKAVGEALAAFTGSVADTVRGHDGVTIYAGGDDVLAMLPVPRALECAAALSQGYAGSFATEGVATLSAAVVFAHVRLPLRAALAEARRLLDDVAKEENGRDSLAVAVLKRGGLHCEWATTWRRGEASSVDRLAAFVRHLGSDAVDESAGFSSALLHRLHSTLSLLCGWPQWRPGSWEVGLPELDVRAFLRAEVRRSLSGRVGLEVIDARTNEITEAIAQLLPRARKTGTVEDHNQLGVDVLLLARFLASGGAEEES